MNHPIKYLFLPVFLLACLWLPAPVNAADDGVIKVLSSEITGFVRYEDGETPVEELEVNVWNKENEQYMKDWRTITDEYGQYSIKPLPTGRYQIEYGVVKVNLDVVEQANVLVYQPHDIIVVIPQAVAVPSLFLPELTAAGSMVNVPLLISRDPPESIPPPDPPSVVSP